MPGAGQGGHRPGPLGRARPRGAEVLQAAVQGAGLPGADAAGGRPGPPVPLHLGALAQPRRAGAQPQDRQGALRAGQGAADLQPLRAAGQPALRAARGRHRRAPQAALPGHGGARGPHLPGHPQRGPRGRGGRRREPPQGAGEGAAAPPLRPAGAARGRGVDRPAGARAAHLRARHHRRTRCSGSPGPLDLRRAARHRRPAARGPEVPRLRADHPPAAGGGRVGRAGRRVQGDRGATTYSCTTPTTRSPRRCSASSSRPPPTRTCWRSSRRSTAPPATPRSSTPSSTPPRPASRCW